MTSIWAKEPPCISKSEHNDLTRIHACFSERMQTQGASQSAEPPEVDLSIHLSLPYLSQAARLACLPCEIAHEGSDVE